MRDGGEQLVAVVVVKEWKLTTNNIEHRSDESIFALGSVKNGRKPRKRSPARTKRIHANSTDTGAPAVELSRAMTNCKGNLFSHVEVDVIAEATRKRSRRQPTTRSTAAIRRRITKSNEETSRYIKKKKERTQERKKKMRGIDYIRGVAREKDRTSWSVGRGSSDKNDKVGNRSPGKAEKGGGREEGERRVSKSRCVFLLRRPAPRTSLMIPLFGG